MELLAALILLLIGIAFTEIVIKMIKGEYDYLWQKDQSPEKCIRCGTYVYSQSKRCPLCDR